MKVFAIIFSVYLLALSIVPCTDGEVRTVQNEPAKITHSQNQNIHPNKKDYCTPFCTCYCCNTTTVTFKLNVQKVKIKHPHQIKEQFPFIESNYISDFYGSPWRPPIFS